MTQEILLQRPGEEPERIPLEGEQLSLGRSQGNDLCFADDPHLSRRHLVLERKGDDWYARDLESKNGTYVNGTRLATPRVLRQGDRVEAGQLLLVFGAQRGGVNETVVFYPEPATGEPGPGTIRLNLDGVLGPESTGLIPSRSGATEEPAAPFQDKRAVNALIRAGRELAVSRPLPELFALILDLSIDAVGAERGILMTLEGEELMPRAVRGEGFRISTAVRDRVIQAKESLLVRDARLEEAFRHRQSIVGQDIRTMMAVPLQTEVGVIGLVYVDSPHLVRDFSRDDLNLLTVLGNVAANRIEHERLEQVERAQQLLSRDLEQAAEIQRILLPAGAPDIPGVELAGENSACRGVGGDYYDFLPYPDGRIALILGDVSGKGIPAALLMASLQARIQTLSAEPFEPQKILARLNTALTEFSPENRFISLFFCLLDPATGEISYSNAGHNPPMLVRAGGEVELLKGGGLVLGIFPEAEYEGRLANLAPGDLLALYSDGLTEARSPGDEEFGEDRLQRLLLDSRGRPVPEILAHVRETVNAWREGAPPEDDETIVLARRSG